MSGRRLAAWRGLFALATLAVVGAEFLPRPAPTAIARPAGEATPEAVEHFLEVALGSRFGRGGRVLRRWPGEVRISIGGQPESCDRAAVADAIARLSVVLGERSIVQVDGRAAFEIHVVDRADFGALLPEATVGDRSIVWCDWDAASRIVRTRVLVDRTLDRSARESALRELILRGLGLLVDASGPRRSILHGDAGLRTDDYTELDLEAARLLHDPALAPGMTGPAIRQVLGRP